MTTEVAANKKAAHWAAGHLQTGWIAYESTPITASMRFFMVDASNGLMM